MATATAQNTSQGVDAGNNNGGNYNSSFGYQAGDNVTGTNNTFIGVSAGRLSTSGNNNTFVGYGGGYGAATGNDNVSVGYNSGLNVSAGSTNTFLGAYSGYAAAGSNNVFIGYRAGYNEGTSGKLYIDNTDTTAPLIYGDFTNDRLAVNGVMAIGTMAMPSGYKLAVAGKLITEEAVIKLQANWPDFVFDDNYVLPSFAELEKYIRAHKHLPGVPTAAEVKENGVSLGEMNAILLQKLEELTLEMIRLEKRVKELEGKGK